MARGLKLRLSPEAVIRSGEVSTAVPLTLQLTAVAGLVSTDGLRVKSHVRLNDVPAYRGALRLVVMDTVGVGTAGECGTIQLHYCMHSLLFYLL